MLAHLLVASAFAVPCPKEIPAKELSQRFPSMLGQEIRMRAAIERAIDITTALVVADGERFAVLLAPEDLWTGTDDKVFAVMGSTEVPLDGPTRLPHLMLVTEPRCTSKQEPSDTRNAP